MLCLLVFKVGGNNLSDHVCLFLVVLLIFKVGRNNLSGHVYLLLVIFLIFKVSRNNLSDHIYLFLVVLLIFKNVFTEVPKSKPGIGNRKWPAAHTPQNSYSHILRSSYFAGRGLLAIFYFLYLVLSLALP